MPPDSPAGDALQRRLEALSQRIPLSLDARDSNVLIRYLALLQRWNAAYNLTAVREPDQMLTQHLLDCLAIVPALRRHCADSPKRVLDVGSGGGLPGVVIAALNPQLDVTCVDSVGKKAAFIQQAAAELNLRNLHARHGRVEKLADAAFDLVTARALSSLPDFVRMTRNHVAPGGVWMAMKGKHPADEIATLPVSVGVFHVEQLDVPDLGAERCLVWMRLSL